jgi:hypothetical protein
MESVTPSSAALRTQQQTTVDFSRRFPLQPAAALAPRPPTSGHQRWAGSTSTLITPLQHDAHPSSDHERFRNTSESQRRVLTGYPCHTTQRASHRMRVKSADVDHGQEQHVAAASAPVQHVAEHPQVPPHPESRGEARETQTKSKEEVSFTPSPAGQSEPPDEAAVKHQSSSNRSSPRGHQSGGLFPQLRSPENRPQSNVSMLYAPDHQLVRTSSRGGALSANTAARVERSEQRKVLLEQQLALERAYWNTKSAFQGLRAQAEQHIYARELTALWTERTDKSPYWKNQVQGLRHAQHSIDQWRRNPEYVTSPKRRRRGTQERLPNDESSAALIAAFPQSIAWAATAACTSPTHDHVHHRPLDHRVVVAPLVPKSSWRAALPMYQAQPPVESPERVQSLRNAQRSPRSLSPRSRKLDEKPVTVAQISPQENEPEASDSPHVELCDDANVQHPQQQQQGPLDGAHSAGTDVPT